MRSAGKDRHGEAGDAYQPVLIVSDMDAPNVGALANMVRPRHAIDPALPDASDVIAIDFLAHADEVVSPG